MTDPDPVTAARDALRDHNLRCAPCTARSYLERHDAPGAEPFVVRCSHGLALVAAWRKAVRDAAANYASANDRITTTDRTHP